MTKQVLGAALAAVWILGGLLGLLAFRKRRLTLPRKCMAILTLGLMPEAAGWLAWGRDVWRGYELAEGVSCIALAALVVVQVRAWRAQCKSSPM